MGANSCGERRGIVDTQYDVVEMDVLERRASTDHQRRKVSTA